MGERVVQLANGEVVPESEAHARCSECLRTRRVLNYMEWWHVVLPEATYVGPHNSKVCWLHSTEKAQLDKKAVYVLWGGKRVLIKRKRV